ncbi:MAG: hypothetical protein CW346_11040 [Bacillaceae bacterium]|nr:hypothetical protein [Bacillaceae bacterium]
MFLLAYIIENARIYKNNDVVNRSMLVDKDKILQVKPSFAKYRYMKMNLDRFWMAATYVFCSHEIPESASSADGKRFFIRRFLAEGCTTVLAVASIRSLHEWKEKVDEVRRFYQKGPLDFVIGIKIPLRALTVPLVRKCKTERIPAIFVEITDPRELYRIPWGWIREALFPYNPPLIPCLSGGGERERLLAVWQTVLERERIPFVKGPVEPYHPVKLEILKKIGIYPLKGYLHTGGELSYNLFIDDGTRSLPPDKAETPAVTVHKGEIVRVLDKIMYRPNKGEELVVYRPAFFS